MWDMGMVKDIEVNPDTIEDVLEIFSYNKYGGKMMNTFRLRELDNLENPGVQVNIIYSGMRPTLSKMYFHEDPKSDTLEDRFADPS
jgi:hypothetical protein